MQLDPLAKQSCTDLQYKNTRSTGLWGTYPIGIWVDGMAGSLLYGFGKGLYRQTEGRLWPIPRPIVPR